MILFYCQIGEKNMTASKIIGIDLGGTSIKFGILTLDGEVQDKWSIPTNIFRRWKTYRS